MLDDINTIWGVKLCTKEDGSDVITVCHTLDGKEKAEELCKDLNSILDKSYNPLYEAKVCCNYCESDEIGTIKFVTSYDIKYEFKIIRYGDTVKLKPVSENAIYALISCANECHGTLKTIETFLTSMYKTIDAADTASFPITRKDRIFKYMASDFITEMLNANVFVKSFNVYRNMPENDNVGEEFPLSLHDNEKVAQEQNEHNEHAHMICDVLNRADSNIWTCQDLYTTYNDLLGVFYIIDENDKPYRFVISRYNGQVTIELVDFTSFGIIFNDIKDPDQKEFIEDLDKYLDMIDDLMGQWEHEYNLLTMRNYIVKIIEREFNMSSKLANKNRLYVFLLKRVIEEKNKEENDA